MEIVALCFLCIALGLVIGYEWGSKQKNKVDKTPAPLDLGYDPNNPMNCGRKRETVVIDGYEWYRMN